MSDQSFSSVLLPKTISNLKKEYQNENQNTLKVMNCINNCHKEHNDVKQHFISFVKLFNKGEYSNTMSNPTTYAPHRNDKRASIFTQISQELNKNPNKTKTTETQVSKMLRAGFVFFCLGYNVLRIQNKRFNTMTIEIVIDSTDKEIKQLSQKNFELFLSTYIEAYNPFYWALALLNCDKHFVEIRNDILSEKSKIGAFPCDRSKLHHSFSVSYFRLNLQTWLTKRRLGHIFTSGKIDFDGIKPNDDLESFSHDGIYYDEEMIQEITSKSSVNEPFSSHFAIDDSECKQQEEKYKFAQPNLQNVECTIQNICSLLTGIDFGLYNEPFLFVRFVKLMIASFFSLNVTELNKMQKSHNEHEFRLHIDCLSELKYDDQTSDVSQKKFKDQLRACLERSKKPKTLSFIFVCHVADTTFIGINYNVERISLIVADPTDLRLFHCSNETSEQNNFAIKSITKQANSYMEEIFNEFAKEKLSRSTHYVFRQQDSILQNMYLQIDFCLQLIIHYFENNTMARDVNFTRRRGFLTVFKIWCKIFDDCCSSGNSKSNLENYMLCNYDPWITRSSMENINSYPMYCERESIQKLATPFRFIKREKQYRKIRLAFWRNTDSSQYPLAYSESLLLMNDLMIANNSHAPEDQLKIQVASQLQTAYDQGIFLKKNKIQARLNYQHEMIYFFTVYHRLTTESLTFKPDKIKYRTQKQMTYDLIEFANSTVE